jgi:hypothetical protein
MITSLFLCEEFVGDEKGSGGMEGGCRSVLGEGRLFLDKDKEG